MVLFMNLIYLMVNKLENGIVEILASLLINGPDQKGIVNWKNIVGIVERDCKTLEIYY